MPQLSKNSPPVSTLVIAGLLLAALEHLRRLNLPHPTATEILSATNAGRSRAYEYREMILEHLPALERPVGRPPAPSLPVVVDMSLEVTREVLRFVTAHPGCVATSGGRKRYSDSFRRFILDVRERQAQMSLDAFATAIDVPLGTVEDWLRNPIERAGESTSTKRTEPVSVPQIESVLAAWRQWDGSFEDFCRHVQQNLRIPHGRTWISSILEAHRERCPHRRPGRKPDAEAIRGAFETFFPGAQWVGDGTEMNVRINNDVFTFNLELNVDAHSGARVGASIRDTEDGAAVTEAFEDGVATTGESPIALLLDNRPSNHTEEVDDALGETIRIRSTPYRAENKAHVEGSFGLFKQVAPPLEIHAQSLKELARQFLVLFVIIWGRASNHVPRADRSGRSRFQIHKEDKPTPEQIAEAKAALRERWRKQEHDEQTRRAHQDPLVRSIVDDAFARLKFDDPEGRIRNAIAKYSLNDVLAGIATFEGKQTAGTLPPGVEARYLLGIIRNIADQREGLAIAESLLRARLDARDRSLEPLRIQLDSLLKEHPNEFKPLVDQAMATDRFIDRIFWLDAVVSVIRRQTPREQSELMRQAARRIHAIFRAPYRERLFAVRYLLEHIMPLDSAASRDVQAFAEVQA